MLPEISTLETAFIHCLDNCAQQDSELLGQTFEFCVQRILHHIVIDIADQMNETFLLLTFEGIISRIEIGTLLSKTDRNLATRVANGRFACPELEF